MTTPASPDLLTPVHATPVDAETTLEDGIALCLSGGGYRAMIFHVGVLWRLNETKVLRKIKLTDGGMYDNLALETAWKRFKTILVSDAGGHVDEDPDPASDWLQQTARVLKLVDNQVRSLRKRQVIESFGVDRKGMYVGIRSAIASFPVSVLEADPEKTTKLADLGTRLGVLGKEVQERLINWGYIVCDAGLRSHVSVEAALDDPTPLPYPNEPLQ